MREPPSNIRAFTSNLPARSLEFLPSCPSAFLPCASIVFVEEQMTRRISDVYRKALE
jgi:hypothetical protein